MRLFDDLLFTIIPLLTVIKMWKHKKEYNLLVGDSVVSILCGICFLFIFVSQKNFSLAEIYRAFFYLIFTAGCEECFFRGYLYHSFLPMNKVFAIILSGMMWGSVHAIMPAIFNGLNLSEMLISIFNYVGGGIVVGYFYIYLQEKSNGIIVPILLHTVSDYGHGYIGPLFFAGIIIWYMYKTKRTCKKLRGKKS